MISLIHPSRGRPEKSFKNSKEWIEKAGCEVELIVSIDNDDPLWVDYALNYSTGAIALTLGCDGQKIKNGTICQKFNSSVVEATNHAAKVSHGDILVYLSDDFKCFDNWGVAVQKEFENESRPLLLKIDDCLQKFTVPVCTMPIMNRALYDRLGYFFHPEYKSMFCDEQIYWVTQKLGAMKMCPHLKFEHAHVCVGKAPDDETYRRSAANWEQGKAVFLRHKAEGFPV